jgi:phosphoenolpyruvate synthase/pyruvate phosphate dikinase
VSIRDPICKNSAVSGGKGSSLAAMLQCDQDFGENVKIPPGICTTVKAFEKHISAHSGIQKALARLEQDLASSATGDGGNRLESACAEYVEGWRLIIADVFFC